MKKIIFCILLNVLALGAIAQVIEFSISEVTQYGPNDLYFCDSITQIIVHKNPDYNGTPFWIDQNDEVTHSDSVILTNANDGKLVYIEKDNDLLISINIYIMENNMPIHMFHGIWLSEGETQTLYPTPQDEGYSYVWESSNWPLDSLYYGYTLAINEPGFYRCNMYDGCSHYSKVEYFANQDPMLDFVTTNLTTNTNEVHWTPYANSFYDTLNIYRDGQFAGQVQFQNSVWIDPIVNNADSAHRYSLEAVKNSSSLVGQTSWKSGITLQIADIYDGYLNLSFTAPGNGDSTPLQDFIQCYQLYSIEPNGFGLINSMIPISVNELVIPDDYNTLVVAAVLLDGTEIYSNVVSPKASSGYNSYLNGNIQIYPNPTTGLLNISANMDAEYQIFDMNGKMVGSGNLQRERQLNVSNFSKGMYTIKIHEKGKQPFSEKIILQ